MITIVFTSYDQHTCTISCQQCIGPRVDCCAVVAPSTRGTIMVRKTGCFCQKQKLLAYFLKEKLQILIAYGGLFASICI